MQTNKTESTKAIIIKLTFLPTQENRIIALPEVSFGQLASKACSLFNLGQSSSINMYYFDDETDRVTVSFDDELSYAVEMSSPEPLHLFISPIKLLDADPMDKAALKDEETSNSETEEAEVAGRIKPRCKHHWRNHPHRHHQHHHPYHSRPHHHGSKKMMHPHPYGHHAPHRVTDEEELDQGILEPLLKQLEEKGFGGNKGKDKRNLWLLRKLNYDVALVEAFLDERRTRRHEARMHQFKGHKMDFHRFHHDEEGHERKHRCGQCLFRKIDGDPHHGHWKARFMHRHAGKQAWPNHHCHHTQCEDDRYEGVHERMNKHRTCIRDGFDGDHA